jgi:riboflavin kinase/FMN adenylyltransferase
MKDIVYVMKFSGTVVKGAMLGRKMNFPTINLLYSELNLPFGVYVCRVKTPLGVYRGAMHFGPKFFANNEEPSLEIHLLDFSGDLYGARVEVEVFGKIRDVKEFDNMESLKRQIRLDVEFVRGAVIE